jgi:hypothetical protein
MKLMERDEVDDEVGRSWSSGKKLMKSEEVEE